MKLVTKVSVLLTSTILLTTIALGLFLYYAQIALIERSKTRELTVVASVIDNSLQQWADEALIRSSLIAKIPQVQQAFRAGDREKLIGELLPTVQYQYNLHNLRSASFFQPPASTFLIMLDLKRPVGEDVSSYREMLTTASRRQEPQKGIELGRSGVSLRGVTPIKDEKGLIGVFDIGLDFSMIASEIKHVTGYEVGIFVNEELMNKFAINAPKPEPEQLIGGMRSIQATDWQRIRGVATSEMISQTKDVKFYNASLNGVAQGVLGLPLIDFSGRQIGVILAVRSFSDYQKQANQAMNNVLLFGVLQFVLMTGVALIITRGMILRPLTAITEVLAALEDGKGQTAAAIDKALLERKDEIGRLAKGCQALRDKLETQNSQTASPDNSTTNAGQGMSTSQNK